MPLLQLISDVKCNIVQLLNQSDGMQLPSDVLDIIQLFGPLLSELNQTVRGL